jgi:hypothetical protein
MMMEMVGKKLEVEESSVDEQLEAPFPPNVVRNESSQYT